MFAYCGNDPAVFNDDKGTRRKKDPIAGIDLGDFGLDGDGTGLCLVGGWGYTTSVSVNDYGTTTGSTPTFSISYVSDSGATIGSTSSCYYGCYYDIGAASQALQSCADAANALVFGYGPVVGTFKHTAFANNVIDLGNQSLQVEQSYMGGQAVSRGTKGSIRFDAVLLNENNIPICAWDFKTGSARLTEERIRTMLKKSGLDIPIIEIR